MKNSKDPSPYSGTHWLYLYDGEAKGFGCGWRRLDVELGIHGEAELTCRRKGRTVRISKDVFAAIWKGSLPR